MHGVRSLGCRRSQARIRKKDQAGAPFLRQKGADEGLGNTHIEHRCEWAYNRSALVSLGFPLGTSSESQRANWDLPARNMLKSARSPTHRATTGMAPGTEADWTARRVAMSQPNRARDSGCSCCGSDQNAIRHSEVRTNWPIHSGRGPKLGCGRAGRVDCSRSSEQRRNSTTQGQRELMFAFRRPIRNATKVMVRARPVAAVRSSTTMPTCSMRWIRADASTAKPRDMRWWSKQVNSRV